MILGVLFKCMFYWTNILIFCLLQLLIKNPRQRFGCLEKGGEEIKTHPFFKRVDWEKIEAREVQPPFKPKIVSYLFLVQLWFFSICLSIKILLYDWEQIVHSILAIIWSTPDTKKLQCIMYKIPITRDKHQDAVAVAVD